MSRCSLCVTLNSNDGAVLVSTSVYTEHRCFSRVVVICRFAAVAVGAVVDCRSERDRVIHVMRQIVCLVVRIRCDHEDISHKVSRTVIVPSRSNPNRARKFTRDPRARRATTADVGLLVGKKS